MSQDRKRKVSRRGGQAEIMKTLAPAAANTNEIVQSTFDTW